MIKKRLDLIIFTILVIFDFMSNSVANLLKRFDCFKNNLLPKPIILSFNQYLGKLI